MTRLPADTGPQHEYEDGDPCVRVLAEPVDVGVEGGVQQTELGVEDHTPDQCTGGDGDQTWDVEDRLEQTSALESLLAERHGEQQRHDDGQRHADQHEEQSVAEITPEDRVEIGAGVEDLHEVLQADELRRTDHVPAGERQSNAEDNRDDAEDGEDDEVRSDVRQRVPDGVLALHG